MANEKITELGALGETPADTDVFPIVDVSDTTQSGSGSTKKVAYSDIKGITISSTDTLTNKTIDADNNTLSNIVLGAEATGASTALTDTADITYNADTDVSANGWVVDEDNMVSDLATKVPTQQSVKAYVDTQVGGAGGAWTHLGSASISGADAHNVDVTSLSGNSYKALFLKWHNTGIDTDGGEVRIRINADSGGNHSYKIVRNTGSVSSNNASGANSWFPGNHEHPLYGWGEVAKQGGVGPRKGRYS